MKPTRIELENATNAPGMITMIIPTSTAPLWCLQLSIMSLILRSDLSRIVNLIVTINGPDAINGDPALQDEKYRWLCRLRKAALIPVTIQRTEGHVGHSQALESAMPWARTEFVATCHDDTIITDPSWIADAIARFAVDDRLALLSHQLWTGKDDRSPWQGKVIRHYKHLLTHLAMWRKAAIITSGGRWTGYHADIPTADADIVSLDIGACLADDLIEHGCTLDRLPESACRHLVGASWGTPGRILDGAEPHCDEIEAVRTEIETRGWSDLVTELMSQEFSAISYMKMVAWHDAGSMWIHQNLFEFREWLRALEKIQPRTMIEIGTYRFGTAEMSLAALPSLQKLVTCDINDCEKDRPGTVEKHRGRLVAIKGDSTDPDTLRRATEIIGEPVDAAFIDGDHSYDVVRSDFERILPLVRNGGLIGFHDVNRTACGDIGSVQLWETLLREQPEQCQTIDCTSENGPWEDYGIGIYTVKK